ncbi:MAG: hypothetical protein ACP5XB_06645 [Isosphaeraceae bacterium]
MKQRSRRIIGAVLLLVGVMVACNGLVSGPHAFGGGWHAVVGIVIAGGMLFFSGAWDLWEAGQTA